MVVSPSPNISNSPRKAPGVACTKVASPMTASAPNAHGTYRYRPKPPQPGTVATNAIGRSIKPVVRTVGTGWVGSIATHIYLAPEKENRLCLPNTRFLLHEPRGGVGGSVSDIQIQADQIRIMRERFHRIFADATGQPEKKIAKDTERDFWLNTEDAIEYGLLGKVIRSADELS